MAELNGIYKTDFDEIRKYIEKTAAKSSEREEALESLLQIYFEAQENKAQISEIHEGTAKDYAKEICESLPKKEKINVKKFVGICAVFAVFTMAAVFFLLNMSDEYLLKKYGFNHVLSSENEYKILVELQEHGVISYIDEKYEIQRESAWKSELFVTKKGIIEKGFIQKNGIFADEITVDEENETVFIKMHCEKITDEFGNDQIISPAIPMHKNSEKFLEYGTITHFGRSGTEIRIGEAVFYGVIDDIYVSKNGDIHFTAKSELVSGEISGTKNAAENGEVIEIYFGSICTINWERRENKPFFSFKNLSAKSDFYPEYRSATLQKQKDGLTITLFVFIDRSEKIADSGNKLNSAWDDEIIKEYNTVYASDAIIYEGGEKIGLPVEYELTSGEKISEEWFFTIEDEVVWPY